MAFEFAHEAGCRPVLEPETHNDSLLMPQTRRCPECRRTMIKAAGFGHYDDAMARVVETLALYTCRCGSSYVARRKG